MKEIKNYEGLYSITEEGQVWSHRTNKFLTPVLMATGYYKITLYKNKRAQQFTLHNLVATTFIPNPDNKKYIHHINEIKTDNRVCNLMWVTQKENMTYGTVQHRISETQNKPVYCVELDEVFPSQTIAAQELGLNQRHISNCCRGIRKTHGGFHFEYYTEDEPNA